MLLFFEAGKLSNEVIILVTMRASMVLKRLFRKLDDTIVSTPSVISKTLQNKNNEMELI